MSFRFLKGEVSFRRPPIIDEISPSFARSPFPSSVTGLPYLSLRRHLVVFGTFTSESYSQRLVHFELAILSFYENFKRFSPGQKQQTDFSFKRCDSMPASSPSHSHIVLNVFRKLKKRGQKLLTVLSTVDHLKYNILILNFICVSLQS